MFLLYRIHTDSFVENLSDCGVNAYKQSQKSVEKKL